MSANENYLQFFKAYGDTLEDDAEDVIRVVENGVPYYVATGWTDMISWKSDNLFIAKFDTLGETLWRTLIGDTVTLSATSVTVGRVLIETDDHKYLVGGLTGAYGQGDADILLAKFDPDGGLIWAKTYGGMAEDDCECITPIGSNQYLIGGYTRGPTNRGADFLVMQIDSLGDTLSGKVKTCGTAGNDIGWRVIKTADAVVQVGFTHNFEPSILQEAVIIKYNTTLDTVRWAKRVGTYDHYEGFACLLESPDHEAYIAAGGINPGYFGGTQDMLFARFDADDGNLEWAKIWGSSNWDFFATMVQSSHSDSMLCGGWTRPAGDTTSPADTVTQAAIAMFDPASGGLSLCWSLGGSANDFGRSAIETDEGYLLAGRTFGYGQGETDLTLAKFDADRETCAGGTKELNHVTPSWTAQSLTVKLKAWSMEVESLGEGVVLTPPEWTRETICP